MYAYVYVQQRRHSTAVRGRRVQGGANEVVWQYCSSYTLYRFEEHYRIPMQIHVLTNSNAWVDLID